MRVVPLRVGEPRALLDEGVRLLDALGQDPALTLRWYVPDRTAIVLGRGQQDGVAGALTRFSGGGAVLLGPDLLSLDVLLPAGHPLLEGDLGAVFPRVGAAWAAALGDVGVPDLAVHEGPGTARRRGTARDRLLAAVCYATLGRGEVLAGGRKLVGLAQRRRRQGALVQCGLLRRWRPAPLLEALGADPEDAEIAKAAVGLSDLCEAAGKGSPSDAAVMAAVEHHLGMISEGGA